MYGALTFYPVLWLIASLLIALVFFKKNHVTLLRSYVKEKDNEYSLQITELQSSLERLKRKLEFNKLAQLNN
jgi:hypothetical protein